MIQKPMLALSGTPDLTKVRFPVLVSPKLDGIRCVVVGNKALTRKLKPVPNHYVREWVESHLPEGFDGELLLSDLTADYNAVQSAIMSADGEPDFVFAAFDRWLEGRPFKDRIRAVHVFRETRAHRLGGRLLAVPHVKVSTVEELLALQQEWLDQGFEGAMIRCPNGPYKFGRSTEREGYLMKLKRFVDEEAEVIGVQQLMKNENELTEDELGYAKRSSAKDGKVPLELMGALRCRTADGAEFGIGSGFTLELRRRIWDDVTVEDGMPVHAVVGAHVKFKHQAPPKGRKPGQAPRIPVFLGFRNVEVD